MEEGRIVEQGTRDQIFDAPSHPYTMQLVESIPPLCGVKVRNVVNKSQKGFADEFDLTYIFISHDLSLMRNFCNRVAIMFRGEICEQGDTEKVFSNPRHLYTKALLSSIPVITVAEDNLKPKLTKADRDAVLASSTALNG